MPETIEQLNWSTLTEISNRIKSPNSFLKSFLFSNHRSLVTESIEYGELTSTRGIAPFVRVGAEAELVDGLGQTNRTVSAPNIRIKRPFTPTPLMYKRPVGQDIFVSSAGTVASGVEQVIARDLQDAADKITNAEEYLCSLALQGAISYTQTDQANFTITFPRSASHNITLGTFWDGVSPTPLQDIHAVKRVLSEDGLVPTDAICGTEAADTILSLAEAGTIKLTNRDSSLTSGTVTFESQFREDGVIYLGRLGGVDFWEYGRTATLPDGTTVNMIRPKYVEFVNRNNAVSERVLYYASIPDMRALQGRSFVGERYTKSWMQEDPSAIMYLMHSRPLPVPRFADATVSVKVVSG